MTWTTQVTNALVYHQFTLETPQPMTEVSNQIEDGTMFFAMPVVRLAPSGPKLTCSPLSQVSSQTFIVDTNTVARSKFMRNGTLTDQIIAPPFTIGGCVYLPSSLLLILFFRAYVAHHSASFQCLESRST